MNLQPPLLARLAAFLFAAGVAFASPAAIPQVSQPRFTHPGAGQVFYFVLTDRFANGNTANDTGGMPGGREQHGFDPTVISHYHGGDLKGLTGKLDYLQGLGITAIWITPPFVNNPVQLQSAGYHGYWILDFTRIDPHLGTETEFRNFVTEAKRRGIRVYLDIIVNHTGDVIRYRGGKVDYIDIATAPYRDASGKVFDAKAVAWNGLGSASNFPKLTPQSSFAYVPEVAPGMERAKSPDWLNDLTLYHNRGNSLFREENSLHGDFVGLDDVFTEHPRVVQGFTEVYSRWMREHGIDGFRIDTAKHANLEFWQAFAPAIQDQAHKLGRPDFFQFGEVMDEHGDSAFLSEYTTTGNLDACIDFGFFEALRAFLSQEQPATRLGRQLELDDYFTDHDSNVYGIPTFVSNHDHGRFAWFLRKDNPKLGANEQEELTLLAHALLLTARGQPVLYYGDEQGMVGTGNDMAAREDMFPSKASGYKELALLGTARTGSDDKFDSDHRYYRSLGALARLRQSHKALAQGAMLIRENGVPEVFAFSRIERKERVEYLVAANRSRTKTLSTTLPTAQPQGTRLLPLFNSRDTGHASLPELNTRAGGGVEVRLAPMQLAIWRAEIPLARQTGKLAITLTTPRPKTQLAFGTRTVDGVTFTERRELRAEVHGGDGFAEVTFALARASRPGQYEILGTDDAPPYRVFWRPSADLAADESLTFIATVDDLRGELRSAAVSGIGLAPGAPPSGIQGSKTPQLIQMPERAQVHPAGADLLFSPKVEGTEPLLYQWLHKGEVLPGATDRQLRLRKLNQAQTGTYVLRVHNREGTVVSEALELSLAP